MIVPLPQTGHVVPIMLSSADGSLAAGCGEAAAFFVDAVDDVAADFAAAFFGAAVLFFFLTSSLKKHTFYNLLINNILYLCVT